MDKFFRVSWTEPGFGNFSVADIEPIEQTWLTAMKACVQFS